MKRSRLVVEGDSIFDSFKKRGRFDIICDILSISRTPAKKSRVSNRANLRSPLLEEYIQLLISKGMLTENDGMFLTTEKGNEYLEDFEHLQEHLDN